MTTQAQTRSPPSPDPAAAALDESLVSHLSILARDIRRTPGRLALYLLVTALTLVIVLTAAAQVALNAWNEPFYNAIEQRQLDAFFTQLGVFFVIAGGLLVLNVSQRGLDRAIRLKLRELATTDLIRNWMSQKRAARISRVGQIGVNPDQRMHEDTNHLTELTTDLGVGLLQATLLLVSFIGVLWSLSRGLVLTWNGSEFVIPGYMVWAALIYAITGSWLSWLVGRRLVQLQRTRYAREADLRVALVRGAEQADGIVLNNGERDEQSRLEQDLKGVLAVTWRIVFATVRLTWVTAGYGWVALVFPIIVAAPGYFSGALSFGELMMVVGAFNQVQQSLRWFVDNTDVIADWRATLLRVMTFRQALLHLDELEEGVERFERTEHENGHVEFDDLAVMSFRGSTELDTRSVLIESGERVLITGKPGSGKSTFFLAVAGLWNWGSGRISMPREEDVMYLSQRPFIPYGSLREALTYTNGHEPVDDSQLAAVLKRVGLEQLSHSLDRVDRWDKELTIHEQQLLAFARVILRKPAWLISDETLDMIEEVDHDTTMSVFTGELAATSLISISGRPPHNGLYTRVMEITARPLDNPEALAKAIAASGKTNPGKAEGAQ